MNSFNSKIRLCKGHLLPLNVKQSFWDSGATRVEGSRRPDRCTSSAMLCHTVSKVLPNRGR